MSGLVGRPPPLNPTLWGSMRLLGRATTFGVPRPPPPRPTRSPITRALGPPITRAWVAGSITVQGAPAQRLCCDGHQSQKVVKLN